LGLGGETSVTPGELDCTKIFVKKRKIPESGRQDLAARHAAIIEHSHRLSGAFFDFPGGALLQLTRTKALYLHFLAMRRERLSEC
jgi:hypothetical protein